MRRCPQASPGTTNGETHDGGSIRPSFLLRSRHGLVLWWWKRDAERRRLLTATATATAPVTVTVGLAGAGVGVGSSW